MYGYLEVFIYKSLQCIVNWFFLTRNYITLRYAIPKLSGVFILQLNKIHVHVTLGCHWRRIRGRR